MTVSSTKSKLEVLSSATNNSSNRICASFTPPTAITISTYLIKVVQSAFFALDTETSSIGTLHASPHQMITSASIVSLYLNNVLPTQGHSPNHSPPAACPGYSLPAHHQLHIRPSSLHPFHLPRNRLPQLPSSPEPHLRTPNPQHPRALPTRHRWEEFLRPEPRLYA